MALKGSVLGPLVFLLTYSVSGLRGGTEARAVIGLEELGMTLDQCFLGTKGSPRPLTTNFSPSLREFFWGRASLKMLFIIAYHSFVS